MQYLFSVIDDQDDAGAPAERAAIDVLNDRLLAEDRWVFASEGSLACNRNVEVPPFLDDPA